MASFAITASIQRLYNSHKAINSQQFRSHARSSRSFATKQSSHFVTLDTETPKRITIDEPKGSNSLFVEKAERETLEKNDDLGGEDDFLPKFTDERWKNGTWDLNMFVKNGKMDWDGVIVAEARRRKFLEVYPQVSTNQEQVLFRSSIIPLWAWITHSHLPEAELLNGRAAMVGFFMAYLVDALTGLNMVGQAGNFVCKVGLFLTVFGILLFRKKEDLGKLKSLADEATFYDKQWQASWQDQDLGGGTSK